MDEEQKGLLIVLCGLPGSGKSTLAQLLARGAEHEGRRVVLIHFDEALHSRDDFDPSLWKVSRDASMKQACMALDNRYIVIMDDTMHYRSMRLQCWKIARLHSSCYCQIYVDCDFSVCCARNAERPPATRLPSAVMDRMRLIFEPPNQSKHPWDALTIQCPGDAVGDTIDSIWKIIVSKFWNDPAPPLRVESELDPTIRELTTETCTHQVDIQSRKIIGEFVNSVSNSQIKGNIAFLMNQERQALLDRCRKTQTNQWGSDLDDSVKYWLDGYRQTCITIVRRYDG